ncbi:MAG: LysR family transcriptional regulator [Caulobacteraceae bacterium]
MTPIQKKDLIRGVTRQRADWSDLRVFWAVVELGSFTKAARSLGMTQPTVTRRIEDLENRLAAKLLHRDAGAVTLTQAGELVYDHVATMESSSASIERLVFNKDRQEEGRVGILASDAVGSFVVAPALSDFLRTNPKISVSLDCGFWPDSVVSGHVDVSLQFDQASNPDVIATPIAYFHYGLFAAQSYLDLYGAPTSWGGVADHRYVHHSAQQRQKDQWAVKFAAFQGLANVTFESNSSAATLLAVKHGAGIGAMPTVVYSVEPDLVMLDIPVFARLTLWMCVHRDAARSARIQRVTEWLHEVFDARTKPWYRPEFIHPSEFPTWQSGLSVGAVA